MASISDYVLDAALSKLDTEADEIHICSAEPTVYAALSSLGNSASLSIGAPADRAGGGREVTVAAITDGEVTATGTATHFAIVDTVNSRLLVTGSLTASQAVTNGNSFSLASFKIGIPDPA
ncbi:hypothetical protein SAMN06265173_12652 [Thalassovita litoralis]|uniref:Uncharacterized protein n=1 Tax=Thalassovita litoralis TaxID=1010611 RepID=A0A521FCB8_9RHOB|nr:hypothetical protein [Thalassovita litoralis]SMO93842.1 hypothetical protein SAMN06265173_12652 [Thalassovita litoralis]